MAVIEATWTPPDYDFIRDFLVDLTQGATTIDHQEIPVGTNAYESPTVDNNEDFVITVRVRSVLGPVSAPVSFSIHTTGNTVARYRFVNPTLSNMREMYDYATGSRYWVTAMPGDQWNSLFTSALQTYTDPLLTYHASGTSTLTTEELNMGAAQSASFVSDMDTDGVDGSSFTNYIETRSSGTDSWTRHSGLTLSTTTPRVRVSSEALTTATQRVNDMGEIIATA